MSDKFKVGQLVWGIGYASGHWYPGAILEQRREVHTFDPSLGHSRVSFSYLAQFLHNINAIEEHMLRPRDPDQFAPADEDFELPVERYESIK